MGDYKAGISIIVLMVWFAVVYLVVTASLNATTTYGMANNITMYDGGMSNQNSYYENDGGCFPPSSINYFPRYENGFINQTTVYKCSKLLIEDETECSGISGCAWTELNQSFISKFFDTIIFWDSTDPIFRCDGYVNKTAFGLDSYTVKQSGSGNYCKATGLNQDPSFCAVFGCSWYNYSTIINDGLDTGSSHASVIKTISYMAGFNVNLGTGLNENLNLFIAILIFWVPAFLLAWSIYMALPFLH